MNFINKLVFFALAKFRLGPDYETGTKVIRSACNYH